MNTFVTRTAVAVSSLALLISCGTGTNGDAAPDAGPQDRPEVSADAVYDGWIVRARLEDTPPPCAWSPDQIQRMIDADRPLPACVRRLQRWFEEEYDPR